MIQLWLVFFASMPDKNLKREQNMSTEGAVMRGTENSWEQEQSMFGKWDQINQNAPHYKKKANKEKCWRNYNKRLIEKIP